MPATIDIDLGALQARFAESNLQKAQTKYAMNVAEDMNAYVHEDTKQTQDSMRNASDFANGLIVWDTDWAKRAYDEDPGPRDKNPKATPHWDKAAKRDHLEDWRRASAELMKGLR